MKAARRPTRGPLITLGVGVALLMVLLYGGAAYGWLTSGGKLAASLEASQERVEIQVEVPFEPERYHLERLGDYGSFAGRGETPNHVQLVRVLPDDLETISRLYWVASIEPMQE